MFIAYVFTGLLFLIFVKKGIDLFYYDYNFKVSKIKREYFQ